MAAMFGGHCTRRELDMAKWTLACGHSRWDWSFWYGRCLKCWPIKQVSREHREAVTGREAVEGDEREDYRRETTWPEPTDEGDGPSAEARTHE